MKKILDKFLLIIKGIVMGLANVIPGVSGGTLAIILGIYDKLIDAISSIIKKFKENFVFLILVLIGMGIGIILGAKVVDFGLSKFPLATILLFVGMIIGGIPLLFKKINTSLKSFSNYIIFIIIFVAFLLYSLFAKEHTISVQNIEWYHYLIFFLVGIVGAATMLMPGISGSLTLMAMGYYDLIVRDCVKNILDFDHLVFHLQVLIPFGIGCIFGLVIVAKLINYLLKHFEVKTYFAIFGFIFASLIIIFTNNLTNYNFNVIEFIIGIILLFIGFSFSYSLSNGGIYIGIYKINKKKNNSLENKD